MLERFSRYAISGGVAVASRFVVLIVLVEAWSIRPIFASFVGFLVSIAINYSLQYYWTFRSDREHSSALPRYIAVTFTMAVVNLLVFWVCNEKLMIHYVLSQIIATGIVFVFNFAINSIYTFEAR